MKEKIAVSSTLNECKMNCNLKFIVHLRRNKNYDQRSGFGFDWFRPEYEEKLTKIFNENNKKVSLFKGDNINKLKQTYRSDKISAISPYRLEYIPSFINMFSDIDPNVSRHIKKMQQKGLTLDIETYQIPGDQVLSLENASAVCEFRCDNSSVVITPNKITLSELVSGGYAQDLIRDPSVQLKRKNKKYYRKENAINIKVIGGYIKKDTEIKIIAVYPNGIEEQIGQSIICKNNINKYVVIRPVKMIWGGYYNIIEDYKPFIESFLSQALIKVKFLETEILNSNSKSKGKTFISRSKEYSDYFDYAKKNDYYRVENRDKEVEHLLETRNTIINYYNEFGASLPSKNRTKATIDDDWHKITYLIFTDLNSQTINEELEKEVIAELKALNLPIDKNIKYGSTTIAGVATQKDTGNYWGNGAILYKVITKDPIKNIRTLLHELGHTFGLRHIFEGESSGFTFYTGYSDNIMDYAFTTNKVFKIKVNPYVYDKGKEDIYTNHTLNKFQWELMTNDESINF